MTTKKLSFDIEANSDEAQKALRLLQTAFEDTVGKLKNQQGDIALFKAATADAAKLERQIKAISKAGGDTSALTATLTTQRAVLAQQGAALRSAGINTATLATEQARLRFQVEQATRAFRSQKGAINSAQGLVAIKNVGAAAGSSAAQVARLAAAMLLPAGFAGLVKQSIDAADSLNDLRQITGLSVPALNGLAFAADQSGTDLDALAKGVGKFAKLVDAAKQPTSEQSKLLAGLGISAKAPEAALLEIADVFASLPDGLEKSALAQKLFGKSGTDLIPLLNGGSAALREMIATGQELNPVTAEMAEQADHLNDSLAKLKTSGKGIGTSLAAEMLPGLNQITDAMAQAAKETGSVWETAWVGLGGLGAALFTDDLLTSTQKLTKAQDLLATARRKGFAEDHRWVMELKAQIAAMEERTAAEEKSKQSAEESTKAAESRNAVQKQQSEQLIKIKDYETEQVTAALDAQVKAYRTAQSAIEKTEKDRIALADKNRQRLADLLAPDSQALDLKAQDDATRFGNQAQARSNLNGLLAQSQNALAAGDFEKAIELGEKAAALIAELKEAGAQATSVLAAQLRDIASIQDQALAGRSEGEKAKADEAKAVLDQIKAELETLKAIPIGIDLPKAEAALLEANKRMQALLDANPLTQAVMVGGASSPDNLPAKAAGGLLRGPGTGTSDSILARVSNGEYVVRAAAVRKLGLANLNAINQGRMPALRAAAMRVTEGRRLPRFADGGLISSAVGSLPRPASSGSGATSILNLTLPGVGTFETRADAAVADSLERALRTAALKHGRRA